MDVKYAYYSTSKGYRVVGGTAAHFLKADGSLDNTSYLTTDTIQNVNAIKSFITAGGSGYTNHSLRLLSNDGSNPGLTFYKGGVDMATLTFDGVDNFIFNNSNGSNSKYIIAKGYKKSGSDNNKFLTGSGGDYDARKKEDSWFHSGRNFPQGTLIETDVDYSVTNGDQFLLEMKGNMYGGGNPLIANIQGYIYANTLYSVSGYSTLSYWNYIIALNLNGKLCFWFPSLSYWQGFDVKVTVGYGGLDQGRNRVTGVVDSVDPGGTKRFQIDLEHLLTKEKLNEGFVTLDTTQTITALKQHNANLALGDGYEFRLKGSADSAHYLKHFSDDTDGFGVSTGFTVKPYNDLKINLFKVDSNGNSFTLETHKTKKLISNYTGTTSGQNLGSGGIGNTLELRNYDLYGTNFWTNDWGDGHIQQQRFDGNQVAYNLKLQPLGGLLYYGNNLVATENQIPDVSNFTTYNFLAQNYALRAGSNATDTWAHTSYGLSINPYIPGKTFNAAGACYLQEATYGSAMGYLNSSGTGAGNPTNDWWFRLKMLHNNAGGYYSEIGVKMTGGTNSLRYKRFENGVDGGWVEVWDKQNLTQGNINNWNLAYNNILSEVSNFNNNEGDYTRYYKLDGSSFDRLRIGTGIVDTRITGNGLDSDGSSTYIPNSGIKALNHKLLPLFHEVSGRGYQSSLILKGWTDTYRAWRITGPADVGNQEEDFFLNQTMSDTGDWMKERKIWTDKHFTQANINSWNNFVSSSGIQLNVEFTSNTGSGLVISDHSVGGESGIIDTKETKFVATKRKDYYFYGSDYESFSGLNFHLKSKLFGMGRQANKVDKLTVEGSVKASKNFKSEKEDPDTIFIPNGRLANLKDEIINDQSDSKNYEIRLDPHEYKIDAFTFLEVDDRNRLIHIVGEQVEMGVNFKQIYPKQQIVIYNFDQKNTPMEVQIYGKTIYKLEPYCFLRLYVTTSLKVIIERQQECNILQL